MGKATRRESNSHEQQEARAAGQKSTNRMTPNSDDGQKRCKCKKTMCLKLYCDCFAAGLYCADFCSCQECFNNLDYEDTVDETRQQIELRNPHAFSPKIHSLIQSPRSYIEDGDQLKLNIGKHRKGCNCRKSMCMKKYCECYQANVGCNSECRCEGCKNVFGMRGVYNEAINKTVEKEPQLIGSGFPSHESHHPHNLSPGTPLQHLGHENNTSPTGRYISSPASGSSDMMFGVNIRNHDMTTLDQQSYPNDGESMNQSTPTYAIQLNTRHLESVASLPPKMDFPSNSRASDDYFSDFYL